MILATIKFNCPGTNVTKFVVTNSDWVCDDGAASDLGAKTLNTLIWPANLKDYNNLIDNSAHYIWNPISGGSAIDTDPTSKIITCSYTIPKTPTNICNS